MLSSVKTYLREHAPSLVSLGRQFKAKQWPAGSVVYYTGKRKGGLTPHNLTVGTSGTDSAVIHLCREWARAGREVTVYSNCEGKSGVYDGVRYVEQYLFNPYDNFDVLIILAHPYLMQLPVNARLLCWDWHDVLGDEKTYPRHKIERFDKIFAKSQYQRSLLPDIPDAHFTIATNGIDKKFAELPEQPKSPYKLIYASRYYRGLDRMLEFGWPIIKRHIPEAELHIYHGWVRRELQAQHDDWRQQMEKLFHQEGVFEHGRVSQEKLMAEKATASIHYYACTYPEIDCISIRESAAVGCVPVTTDFAVFKEKDYCVRVAGDPLSPETQEAVAYRIVNLLKDQEALSKLRTQFKDLAKQETWQEIAKAWLDAFEHP